MVTEEIVYPISSVKVLDDLNIDNCFVTVSIINYGKNACYIRFMMQNNSNEVRLVNLTNYVLDMGKKLRPVKLAFMFSVGSHSVMYQDFDSIHLPQLDNLEYLEWLSR
jgi:hypothetical protein